NLTRCLRTSRRVSPVNTAVRDTLVGLPRFPNRSVATSTYTDLADSANSFQGTPQRRRTCIAGLSHWRAASRAWLGVTASICETGYYTDSGTHRDISHIWDHVAHKR